MASSGATWGKSAFIKKEHLPICLNTSTIRFRPNDEKELNREFLFWFLNSSVFKYQIDKLITGSAQPNFGSSHLKQVKIPLPDLKTQQKIASILEQADTARQKRKQANQLIEQFVHSAFFEMFGDPVRNEKGFKICIVGEVCKVTKLAGYEYTKHIKYTDEGEIIVIRGLNVKKCNLKLDKIKYIDKKTSDFLIRSKLFKDDVVMTYIGVNIGDVALIKESGKYHLAPNVAKITPKDFNVLNSIYLIRYLDLDSNKNQFKKYTTNTAKQALNMANIRELNIPIPPIALQQKFASLVERIGKLREKQRENERELENLFQSLMQKYFG